jgi:hypothetical protein
MMDEEFFRQRNDCQWNQTMLFRIPLITIPLIILGR